MPARCVGAGAEGVTVEFNPVLYVRMGPKLTRDTSDHNFERITDEVVGDVSKVMCGVSMGHVVVLSARPPTGPTVTPGDRPAVEADTTRAEPAMELVLIPVVEQATGSLPDLSIPRV